MSLFDIFKKLDETNKNNKIVYDYNKQGILDEYWIYQD